MVKLLVWKWVAGIAATALMGGSMVYYNCVDKVEESKVVHGEEAPNFIAQLYKCDGDSFYVSEEIKTLVSQRGKVCVVNFWETWCSACIQELPAFNRLQEEYADEITVFAVVGNTSSAQGAAKWMSEKGWKDHDEASEWTEFSLSFVYLPQDVCTSYGCSGPLPRTVVVDKVGKVAYEKNSSMHYEDLQALIKPLL